MSVLTTSTTNAPVGIFAAQMGAACESARAVPPVGTAGLAAPRPFARATVTAVTRRITAARAAADLPDPTGERSGLLRLAAAQLLASHDVDQVLTDLYRAGFLAGWVDGAADESLNAVPGRPGARHEHGRGCGMSASYGWHCPVPGCHGHGAGFGSDLRAARAERRHVDQSNLTHQRQYEQARRLQAEQAGGAR